MTEDEDPRTFLELDQLVAEKARPVPRAELSAWANRALWGLLALAAALGGMVIFTFVSQLG